MDILKQGYVSSHETWKSKKKFFDMKISKKWQYLSVSVAVNRICNPISVLKHENKQKMTRFVCFGCGYSLFFAILFYSTFIALLAILFNFKLRECLKKKHRAFSENGRSAWPTAGFLCKGSLFFFDFREYEKERPAILCKARSGMG